MFERKKWKFPAIRKYAITLIQLKENEMSIILIKKREQNEKEDDPHVQIEHTLIHTLKLKKCAFVLF